MSIADRLHAAHVSDSVWRDDPDLFHDALMRIDELEAAMRLRHTPHPTPERQTMKIHEAVSSLAASVSKLAGHVEKLTHQANLNKQQLDRIEARLEGRHINTDGSYYDLAEVRGEQPRRPLFPPRDGGDAA